MELCKVMSCELETDHASGRCSRHRVWVEEKGKDEKGAYSVAVHLDPGDPDCAARAVEAMEEWHRAKFRKPN